MWRSGERQRAKQGKVRRSTPLSLTMAGLRAGHPAGERLRAEEVSFETVPRLGGISHPHQHGSLPIKNDGEDESFTAHLFAE
jgi:hypothetical protein